MIGASETAELGLGGTLSAAILLAWVAFLAIPSAVAIRRRNYRVAGFSLALNIVCGLGLPLSQIMLSRGPTSETLLLWPGFWWFITLIWASSLPHEALRDELAALRDELAALRDELAAQRHAIGNIEQRLADDLLSQGSPTSSTPVQVSAPPPVVRQAPAPPAVSDGASAYSSAASSASSEGSSPANDDGREATIRVRCVSCGRKFSGPPATLARLKACPRCKASPFTGEPA